MSVVMAVAVDDVTYALCDGCADAYVMIDGWQGLCPECGAQLDDHDAGRHYRHPIASCRACDELTVRVELPAIA